MTSVKTWLGYPYPLGATWMGNGVNFALFSETAASVELCLFDNIEATEENIRIPVTEHTDQVWHVFLPKCGQDNCMGFAFPGRTIRSADYDSTVPNSSSIHMRKPSPGK